MLSSFLRQHTGYSTGALAAGMLCYDSNWEDMVFQMLAINIPLLSQSSDPQHFGHWMGRTGECGWQLRQRVTSTREGSLGQVTAESCTRGRGGGDFKESHGTKQVRSDSSGRARLRAEHPAAMLSIQSRDSHSQAGQASWRLQA